MKLLTSIFSQLLEHTARVLLWNLLSCQKCLHAQRMAAMNAWIDMQQTSPLCYPAFATWADRVFRKIGYFRDFRSSIFSVLQHIITYLCDCMCECIAFGTFACLHTCVHTFPSLSYASLCYNVHLWPFRWVCVIQPVYVSYPTLSSWNTKQISSMW